MTTPITQQPTVWRQPIQTLINGDWVGPIACAGHALHYVSHPLMPPIQVWVGGEPPKVYQPQTTSGLNYIRDLQRGVFRLEPGGTLVQREELRDVFVRVDQGDRNHGQDWSKPPLARFLREQTDGPGGTPVQYYPCSDALLAHELHGDDLVLMSGAADVFPRDVRVPAPRTLRLPAFELSGGTSSAQVTDHAFQPVSASDLILASLTDMVPRSVLERYTRLRLVVQIRQVGEAAAPWGGDADLPEFSLCGRNATYWKFQAGHWADDSITELDINLGTPADYADDVWNYGGTTMSSVNAAVGTNCPDAIFEFNGWFELDQGEADFGEVHRARAQGMQADGMAIGGGYWCALPVGKKAARIGILSQNSVGHWYVQATSYLNIGWAAGDYLYSRALAAIDYDSVLIPGAGAYGGPDDVGGPPGGVAVGINSGAAPMGNENFVVTVTP